MGNSKAIALLLAAVAAAGCGSDNVQDVLATPTNNADLTLQRALTEQAVAPPPAPTNSPQMVELGRVLMFDKILSGNLDTSCATCHHPLHHTGDALPVSIGVGGVGLGPQRQLGIGRPLIPRNAPEVFQRSSFSVFFADGRVSGTATDGFQSPAGVALPGGFPNALAVQAMFPVTSRDEMRGQLGELRKDGQNNEIAALADNDFTGIWDALRDRVFAIPEYQTLFGQAFPGLPQASLGFQHVAIAIGAFEGQVWDFRNSPFDRYLRGDSNALTDSQKQGAILFYGKAKCSQCHSGGLLTDQSFHNIAAPQIGVGKGAEAPLDFGRGRETNLLADRYKFRTPPLRNVTLTGPYMHSGAYATLESAVRHHLAPLKSLQNYDSSQLPASLNIPINIQTSLNAGLMDSLDPKLGEMGPLSDAEVGLLLEFLGSLTDPAAQDQSGEIPSRVPSGLPVVD